MQGIPAEFYPWGKMPIRDPADRIARVGISITLLGRTRLF